MEKSTNKFDKNISEESFPASLLLESSGKLSEMFMRSRPSSEMQVEFRRFSNSDAVQEVPIDGPLSLDSEPVKRFRRASTTSSQISKSQDFLTLNKKKFPHVESKVKQFIDEINGTNPVARMKKQKSMPEIFSLSHQTDEAEEKDAKLLQQLREKEEEIQNLREWMKTIDTDLTESKEENLVLKRKIEQMRGRLDQVSERRTSIPISNSFRRKSKKDCCVQTDIEEEAATRSNTFSGKIDSGVQTQGSSFQIIVEDEGLNEILEEETYDKGLLERSIQRLQVSLASRNNYKIFEVDSSQSVTPQEEVVPVAESREKKKTKKSKLLKFLGCSCCKLAEN